MTLDDKSIENIKLVKYVIKINANYYGAIAGRLYYAVFQKIKFILINAKFNYDTFLASAKNNNEPPQKPFSHGTIKAALLEYIISQKKIKNNVLIALNNIDHLYKIRRYADYEDKEIKKADIEICIQYSEEIINLLNNL